MSDGIFVLQDDNLVMVTQTPYDSEAVLQELLARYPDLLAGGQMDGANPRRWVLVAREAALPSDDEGPNRWSVDHLFLDQDAVPTVVEVKRSTDTRIRREVVGQMLDYAANAVAYWPIDRLRAWFEARHDQPDAVLHDLLGAEADIEQFWQAARTNLQAGRIRLVFVADVIPPELRRIVEFLNSHMDPTEVLAVEVRHYAGAGLKALVPRVLGQTAEALGRKSAGRPSRTWDRSSFLAALSAQGQPGDLAIAQGLLKWADERGLRLAYGQGATSGSCFPMLDWHGTAYWTVALWTYGRVELQFQWMLTQPPFDDEALRLELLGRLRALALPGITLRDDAITRRPAIPLSALAEERHMTGFCGVLDWVIEQIKQAVPA